MNPVMRREAGGRGLAYTRTRVRSHMHVYVRTAGANYEWSVRDMAEASVGQATAGEQQLRGEQVYFCERGIISNNSKHHVDQM